MVTLNIILADICCSLLMTFQVIKSRGSGEETSTEYFAALLTTLESADAHETMSAVVTLISMVIKSVPVPVLQSQFAPVSKLLMECLARAQ